MALVRVTAVRITALQGQAVQVMVVRGQAVRVVTVRGQGRAGGDRADDGPAGSDRAGGGVRVAAARGCAGDGGWDTRTMPPLPAAGAPAGARDTLRGGDTMRGRPPAARRPR
jgi:hypothetical protein